MPRFNLNPLFQFLFIDQVRLVELFSGLNLLAWASLILGRPEVLQRDSYVAFSALPASAWVVIFGVSGLFQLCVTFWNSEYRTEMRFFAMFFATSCWALIALSFVASGVGQTATMNYLLLTISCAMSGGFLAWKHF